jgi:hypothetical protein
VSAMNREAEREARRPWRPRWLLRLRVALSKQSLDSRLLAGESPAESPELGERYAQLQRPQYRRGLAERLEHIVDVARAPDWLNCRSARVPLRRREIRQNRPLLLALSRDLVEEAKVQPRGVILTDRLLSDGCSPLYEGELLFATEGRPSVELAVRHARAALQLR